MFRNPISDYIAWLFFPARFVFPDASPKPPLSAPPPSQKIRIPGWEILELKIDPAELTSFNKLVGETFLGGAGNAFLVSLFGQQSAFTLDGPEHRLARKLISQSINTACVNRVVAQVPHYLELELASMPTGSKVKIGNIMRRVTMRAMCLAILGITNEQQISELSKRFEAATGYFANLVSYHRAFWFPKGRFSVGAEVKRRRERIDALIFDAIAVRRDAMQRTRDQPAGRHDLLSHLIASQETHGYSDQFIRDNLVSTLAAGYDTTGSAMTWMMFWLSKEAAPRRQLCESYRAGSADYDRFAEAFVSETMRYCPPLEILPRRPIALASGSVLPPVDEPTLVCPCPHQVHHNSLIYEDPGTFRPDRFLENKFSATEYFPFGLGNRLCLGVILAPGIMKATLDWFIAQDRYLRFDKDRFRPIRRNVSLWPSFSNKGKIAIIEF